jgi:hypothetical protein
MKGVCGDDSGIGLRDSGISRFPHAVQVLSQLFRRGKGDYAIELDEAGPVVALRDGGFLVVRLPRALVIHLEKEEKIGDLLDVVAIGNTVVAEEMAVVPDFVEEVGSGRGSWADVG